MATLSDVQKLGYVTGVASGSVQVEEDALAAARATADPDTVLEQANQMTADTVQTLSNLGRLPETDDERLELAARIGAAALNLLTEHIDERIAFHERALAIAKESPDVWHLSGPGVEIYVACKADGTGWDDDQQKILDALADPAAHAERSFQCDNPDAMAAAATLDGLGHTVTRKPGTDTFDVAGETMTTTQIVAYAETAPPVTPDTDR